MPATGDDPSDAVPPARRRGRPARIDRDRIVAAAREVDAADLTMKTVADALGVTRKALNYHVSDRAELIGLVVADSFEHALDGVALPEDDDWESAVRAYANAIRDGIVKVGELATHYPVSALAAPAAFRIAERVLGSLVAAGFSPRDAGRALTLINDAASDAARQVLLLDRDSVHPMASSTAQALASATSADLPLLREVASGTVGSGYLDEQFAFTLAVLLAGLARVLDAANRS